MHRPTLGSRINTVLRQRGVLQCVCGRPWSACENGRWMAVDGPVPDGTSTEVPLDFIQTRDGVHQIDKQANRGQGYR